MTSDVSALRRAIEAWMDYRHLTGDHRFYTREQWCARKEGIGEEAPLSLTTEGPLFRALTGWVGKRNPDVETELRNLLEKHGYYFDMGYSWSIHFYPLSWHSPASMAANPVPVSSDCDIPF